jgi:hypothetical protein
MYTQTTINLQINSKVSCHYELDSESKSCIMLNKFVQIGKGLSINTIQ